MAALAARRARRRAGRDGRAEASARRATLTPAAAELRGTRLRAGRGAVPERPHAAGGEAYGAIAVGRGANLDTIDVPLNNRVWLAERFARDPRARRRGGAAGGHRRDRRAGPIRGPAASTTTSAIPTRQPHLVARPGLPRIPGSFSPRPPGSAPAPTGAVLDDARRTFYDGPLQMKYAGLDPAARYKRPRGLRRRHLQPDGRSG